MSEHTTRTVDRYCDAVVLGGSAAGLAAAVQLGRQRRAVIVVDAGEPRNAPAAHLHGYLGYDGRPPADLLAVAREEVRSYGGEVLPGRALDVERTADRFRVRLAGGHSIVARRVIVATGLVDELPAIEGVAAAWGRTVIHCPFCHGYEARDRRIVHVVSHPAGLHAAPLFRQLTNEYTVVLHEGVLDAPDVEILRRAGVSIVADRVRRVVTDAHGDVIAVERESGEPLAADVVAVTPAMTARIDAVRSIGVRTSPHPSGIGEFVVVDVTGATNVPGVYAAGNVVDPSHQLLQAAADGARVGAMVSMSLAHEDVAAGAGSSATETDWDQRYGTEPVWSGNPNGTLVAEATSLTPGRALDVGAGEGADALWLAARGWTVTANDISSRALARIAAEAARRGLTVECLHRDVNACRPFGEATFDLVSAQYASIPRTPDGRAVRNLLDAVAPGGTLVVVGHDPEPMRAPVDTREHTRMFDVDAYVRVDDVAAALVGDPGWHVEIHETRRRPPGAVSTHHVDDVVLRARRRA